MSIIKNKEVEPVQLSLFTTLGSLQEVQDLAKSILPITNNNDIQTLLHTYHNTLINVIKDNHD